MGKRQRLRWEDCVKQNIMTAEPAHRVGDKFVDAAR